jgi:hypothetical protein
MSGITNATVNVLVARARKALAAGDLTSATVTALRAGHAAHNAGINGDLCPFDNEAERPLRAEWFYIFNVCDKAASERKRRAEREARHEAQRCRRAQAAAAAVMGERDDDFSVAT